MDAVDIENESFMLGMLRDWESEARKGGNPGQALSIAAVRGYIEGIIMERDALEDVGGDLIDARARSVAQQRESELGERLASLERAFETHVKVTRGV